MVVRKIQDSESYWSSLFTKKVEKHIKISSNENNLNYNNAEHTDTLSANKPYQQHLQENSQNVSGAVQMAIRYERNICTALFSCDKIERKGNTVKGKELRVNVKMRLIKTWKWVLYRTNELVAVPALLLNNSIMLLQIAMSVPTKFGNHITCRPEGWRLVMKWKPFCY